MVVSTRTAVWPALPGRGGRADEEHAREAHGLLDEPNTAATAARKRAFGKVADAFARNFDDGLEVGAAVAIYVDGERVVDLWGGTADPATARPWQPDSLQCVFSSTKGITGLAVAMLVDRDTLDYDEPIATYWPEFAQQGKERITLRDVLCHRAGLPVIDEPVSRTDLADLDRLAGALARHGFFAPSAGNEFSPHAEAFGHAGIGGSIGFADPVSRVGFGYLMNKLSHNLIDPRPRALVDALFASL